mgnify:CR=1 FL=1
MSLTEFMHGAVEGMKAMLTANLILVLAWGISGVCQDMLQTNKFVESLVTSGNMVGGMLPFLFSAMTMEAVGRAAQSMVKVCGCQRTDAPLPRGRPKRMQQYNGVDPAGQANEHRMLRQHFTFRQQQPHAHKSP